MDQQIELKMTTEEVKLVFQGLGKLPFEEVFELIGKLNAQVNQQTR